MPVRGNVPAYYARGMLRSLWDVFAADRVDHADLQHIIQRHFRSGSQPAKRVVIYPGDEPHAIKLRFAKDDRLTHIEAGPALTPETEAAIIRAITDALTPTDARGSPGAVCRTQAHRLLAVQGPVPTDARTARGTTTQLSR